MLLLTHEEPTRVSQLCPEWPRYCYWQLNACFGVSREWDDQRGHHIVYDVRLIGFVRGFNVGGLQ